MAGAFFPQPDPQVPQEEVSEHAREHVVIPSRIFPHLIVIHPKLTLGFLKALLDGPPDTTQPDKGLEARTRRRIADIVGVLGLVAERSFDHQPDGLLREPIARKNDLPLVELVLYRALVPSETLRLYQK